MKRASECDYVLEGAGPAVFILAHRLSGDGRTRVVLLEAGGRYPREQLGVPLPGM